MDCDKCYPDCPVLGTCSPYLVKESWTKCCYYKSWWASTSFHFMYTILDV